MIYVKLCSEPDSFDKNVRQPGLDAISELIGELPGEVRPGPRRQKVAERREDIPAKKFPPFWREALPDMLVAYQRTCAYLALRIHEATGASSVDHVIPKSKTWDQVYEWSNYRLACSLVNSKKSISSVLDPCGVEDGAFSLELVGFQVTSGAGQDPAVLDGVEKTISLLGLNSQECCRAREGYAIEYWGCHISFNYLERCAPFVALELIRQNRLNAGDHVYVNDFLRQRAALRR